MAQPVTYEFDKLTDNVDILVNHVDNMRRASELLRIAGHTYNDNSSIIFDDQYETQRDELEGLIADNLKIIISEMYNISGVIEEIRGESSNVVANIKRELDKQQREPVAR